MNLYKKHTLSILIILLIQIYCVNISAIAPSSKASLPFSKKKNLSSVIAKEKRKEILTNNIDLCLKYVGDNKDRFCNLKEYFEKFGGELKFNNNSLYYDFNDLEKDLKEARSSFDELKYIKILDSEILERCLEEPEVNQLQNVVKKIKIQKTVLMSFLMLTVVLFLVGFSTLGACLVYFFWIKLLWGVFVGIGIGLFAGLVITSLIYILIKLLFNVSMSWTGDRYYRGYGSWGWYPWYWSPWWFWGYHHHHGWGWGHHHHHGGWGGGYDGGSWGHSSDNDGEAILIGLLIAFLVIVVIVCVLIISVGLVLFCYDLYKFFELFYGYSMLEKKLFNNKNVEGINSAKLKKKLELDLKKIKYKSIGFYKKQYEELIKMFKSKENQTKDNLKGCVKKLLNIKKIKNRFNLSKAYYRDLQKVFIEKYKNIDLLKGFFEKSDDNENIIVNYDGIMNSFVNVKDAKNLTALNSLSFLLVEIGKAA